MAKTVRLESNCPTVVESALGFFARHQGQSPGHPEFLWRIVSQEDHEMDEAGVALSAFSDHGLRFANIGQRSFLAVDMEAREGIGFVADRLVEREPKLRKRASPIRPAEQRQDDCKLLGREAWARISR
jgi:hypothetical protein